MGEDVVDASGAAEEADAGDDGDCGCRRSAASECNVFLLLFYGLFKRVPREHEYGPRMSKGS